MDSTSLRLQKRTQLTYQVLNCRLLAVLVRSPGQSVCVARRCVPTAISLLSFMYRLDSARHRLLKYFHLSCIIVDCECSVCVFVTYFRLYYHY
jgi:hypothetical protein